MQKRVVLEHTVVDEICCAPPGQRRSSRITTRGNPPETEVVSAALVKPASSKSLRVPT